MIAWQTWTIMRTLLPGWQREPSMRQELAP